MLHATAADLLALRPRTGAPLAQGELPASLEYKGPHGMINYFLVGVPAPALCARQEVAALEGGLQSLKLLQSEQDADAWWLVVRGSRMDIDPVEYPIAAGEVAALLAQNQITLPGLQPPPDAPDAPPF